MTKKSLIIVMLSIPQLVFAWDLGIFLKNGDYKRNGGHVDMAGDFVAVQNTTLLGVQGPLKIDSKAHVVCQVPKDTEIRAANAITISYKFGVYSMNQEMDIDVYRDGELILVPVHKGEIVEDISYVRGGMCHVRVGAKMYISECLERLVRSRAASKISELIQHGWYEISCKDGNRVRVRYPVLMNSLSIKSKY